MSKYDCVLPSQLYIYHVTQNWKFSKFSYSLTASWMKFDNYIWYLWWDGLWYGVIFFYSWLCFVTVELYCHLLVFESINANWYMRLFNTELLNIDIWYLVLLRKNWQSWWSSIVECRTELLVDLFRMQTMALGSHHILPPRSLTDVNCLPLPSRLDLVEALHCTW